MTKLKQDDKHVAGTTSVAILTISDTFQCMLGHLPSQLVDAKDIRMQTIAKTNVESTH